MLLQGTATHIPLPEKSVHLVVTSPPYFGKIEYGLASLVWPEVAYVPMAGIGASPITVPAWRGVLGDEPLPEFYVAHLVLIFREVRRVLRDNGLVYLNIGDTYNSSPSNHQGNSFDSGWVVRPKFENGGVAGKQRQKREIPYLQLKDLIGIPWRVAFALQADGWVLRIDGVWAQGRSGEIEDVGAGPVMPEPRGDRPIHAHEYIFILSKRPRPYFYDDEAVRVKTAQGNGHRLRSVWLHNPNNFKGSHLATFPPELAETCILAGTSKRGCCPRCQTPWERVIDSPKPPEELKGSQKSRWKAAHPDRLLGWQPGCSCGIDETIPCTVLDPFIGSGSTAVAAERLGRRWVGVDLATGYLQMAKERMRERV
jgi:DNA modification methylase